jgi:hypothetical protein
MVERESTLVCVLFYGVRLVFTIAIESCDDE